MSTLAAVAKRPPVVEKILRLSTAHVPREIAGALDAAVDPTSSFFMGKRMAFEAFAESRSKGSTQKALEFLEVAAAPSPYASSGWILFTAKLSEELPVVLRELEPIRDLAVKHGCRFVLFDGDEPETDELAQFDW